MSDAHVPLEVFCSYAPEDEAYFQQLQKHLSLLMHQQRVALWHHRCITPGIDWTQTIDVQMNRAAVILLLISADFLGSDYCYGIEMQRALERQGQNDACVIPVLARPVDWENAPFKHLKGLPTDGKPISLWRNKDKAFTDVVQGIRRAIEDLIPIPEPVSSIPLPLVWNVPYAPNPFFMGQEALLRQLAETLKKGQPTALSQPQAISGLGGIGKTQIAVEFAYRRQQDYQAIFWVRADTHEALVSGFVALSELLNLPEKDEHDQTITVKAMEQWLKTHREWLLILDNADDLSIVSPFLRSLSLHGGHILLTTRAHVLGPLARHIEVETMSLEVGTLFLLRRAGLIGLEASLETVSTSERVIAQKITEELGGLPLALDQAGAYIQETGCSLARYQQVYGQHCMELLKRRGSFSDSYPESVATTWMLSFEKVKQRNLVAADLLRCCALLHPDAIPEEFFADGAMHLGSRLQQVARDTLVFDDAVRVLLAYSLIRRDPTTAMLSIHRLVQAVLVDAMSAKTRKQWRERIVQAVSKAFPEVTFQGWTKCERLLPHVLVCATWTEQGLIHIPEMSHVLHRAGIYLRARAQYLEAERLLVRSLMIREQHLGAEHLHTAFSLNSLVLLYREQGKYDEAEQLCHRALPIYEQHLGGGHPHTASCLSNLASLYDAQGKYEEAEQLYIRVLAIREQHLGVNHPRTASSLNDLAVLYKEWGKYERARPLYEQALAIHEKHSGTEHPNTASSLNNLANLYQHQGMYEEAEPLYRRALAIKEQQLGIEHPHTAMSLNNLALLYLQQGKYEEAEHLYRRVLTIYEKQLGTDHPSTATILNNLAELYDHQGKYEEAELLCRRALTIFEQQLGTEHPSTAYPLYGLAGLYQQQGKYDQAAPLYQRALAIREKQLGPTHPETQNTRKNYATLLRITGHDAEAAAIEIGCKEASPE